MRLTIDPDPDPAVTALLEEIRAVHGFIPNSMRVLGRSPELLAAVRGLSRVALQPGVLDPHLALIAAHACCRAVGDSYSAAHSAHILAERYNEPLGRLRALGSAIDDATGPLFSAREVAVIDLARAASSVPSRVRDLNVEVVRRHLDEREVLDLFVIISYFGFLNRFNPMLDTLIEPEAQRMASLLGSDPGVGREVRGA